MAREALHHRKLYMLLWTYIWQGPFNSFYKQVVRVILSYDDILAIEKKMYAGIFPNAIRVVTLNDQVLLLIFKSLVHIYFFFKKRQFFSRNPFMLEARKFKKIGSFK